MFNTLLKFNEIIQILLPDFYIIFKILAVIYDIWVRK